MFPKIIIYVLFFWQSAMSEPYSNENPSPTIAHGKFLKKQKFQSGDLIFQDNFETLNTDVWLHEASTEAHADEFELYVDNPENSFVQNGFLHIKPTLYNEGIELTDNMKKYVKKHKFLRDSFFPIRSARLSTIQSFSFTYGVVEIRARLPSGDWLFPALWLNPKEHTYGTFPVSGELDIMESRGNKNLTDQNGNFVGVQLSGSTLHWGPNSTLDNWRLTHWEKEDDSCYSSDFHVYKMVWGLENISFFIDDVEVGTITPPSGGFWELGNFTEDNVTNPWKNALNPRMAPFDQPFYLIINLAVGGTHFFSDSQINEGGKPWSNTSPDAAHEFWDGRNQWLPTWNFQSEDTHFLIDYVKVWAL